MSDKTKVVFNEPIVMEIEAPAPPIPPARGLGWTHTEISDYVASIRVLGFDDGAIVTPRHMRSHDYKLVRNWGVVMNLNTYKDHRKETYLPLAVKWFGKDGPEELWHDDLLIVHKAVSWQARDALFKDQL